MSVLIQLPRELLDSPDPYASAYIHLLGMVGERDPLRHVEARLLMLASLLQPYTVTWIAPGPDERAPTLAARVADAVSRDLLVTPELGMLMIPDARSRESCAGAIVWLGEAGIM